MTNTIPTTARTLTERAKTEGLQVEVTHHPGVAYHLRISNTHGRLIGTGTWDLRGPHTLRRRHRPDMPGRFKQHPVSLVARRRRRGLWPGAFFLYRVAPAEPRCGARPGRPRRPGPEPECGHRIGGRS